MDIKEQKQILKKIEDVRDLQNINGTENINK